MKHGMLFLVQLSVFRGVSLTISRCTSRNVHFEMCRTTLVLFRVHPSTAK